MMPLHGTYSPLYAHPLRRIGRGRAPSGAVSHRHFDQEYLCIVRSSDGSFVRIPNSHPVAAVERRIPDFDTPLQYEEIDAVHRDSMGHAETLSVGEIQVMSAGVGITHSEFNADPEVPVKFLQIWVMTDKQNHTPRYKTVRLDPPQKNRLRLIVAPEGFGDSEHTGWLHQMTWFYTADIEAGREIEYVLNGRGNEPSRKRNGDDLHVIAWDGSRSPFLRPPYRRSAPAGRRNISCADRNNPQS